MKEEERRETKLAIFFFPLVVGTFSGHHPTHNCGSPDQHVIDQLILYVPASQAPFLARLFEIMRQPRLRGQPVGREREAPPTFRVFKPFLSDVPSVLACGHVNR